MTVEFHINSNILTWAIKRAGFELDDFIENKFPRVKDWLDDSKQPTVRQLEDFSKKVHVPFGYLFLEEPPLETAPIAFFRTGSVSTKKVSLNVYDTILLLQARQNWLSDYLKEEGYAPLEFVGKFNLNSDPLAIVADIRKTLKLPENWASSLPNWEKAKKRLAEKIEEAGIILSFNSVFENNNNRKIDVDECRGFVLADPYAPFIFVNAGDGKAAQMFTLAHELAHVWVGQSAGFDLRKMRPADDPFELLCDQVAAEFLVPAVAFYRFWDKEANIQSVARHFKVSPIVAARRALDLGKIDKNAFYRFYHSDKDKWKEKRTVEKSGGGDFYATQKFRLSLRFVGYLRQALRQDKALYLDAYRLTALKGDTFNEFIKRFL